MNYQQPYQQLGQNAVGQAPQGPLAKALAFLLSAAFLVLAFMFSLVALAVVAIAGIALGGWLWWRTRKLRQEINRQRMTAQPDVSDDWQATVNRPTSQRQNEAVIIEGEATRLP